MIVLSDALLVASLTIDTRLPLILYADLVTVSNIAATYASASYPVTNLANAQTSSLWKSGNTGTQYITVTLDGSISTDSMGVARHNWGSAGVQVSIEGYTAASGTWTQLIAPTLLGDDSPALFLFAADIYTGLRFKLVPGSTAPQAAVVYAGKSLRLQRGIQIGHTPIKYGRSRQVLSGSAMNGDFLGVITLSQKLSTTVALKDLDPDWYRTYLQPFIDVCRDPFFFAWAPRDYPREVGFAWCSSDPQPSISQLPGYIDISLQMDGLAL